MTDILEPASRPYEAAKISVLGARARNQDRSLFLSSAETTLLVLGDGLGGHPRGEVAAQLLIDVCDAQFRQADKPLRDPQRFMLQCANKAHEAIVRFGQRQQPPIAPRTTAVLALIQDGVARWAHIGDSRLYLIRQQRILQQTRDHAQLRDGSTPGFGRSRPRTSLTRCLGSDPQVPLLTCGTPTVLQPGDTIVLCSDGFWGQISDQLLTETLGARIDTPLEPSLQDLAEQAASTPGSDNVTVLGMRWLTQARATAPGTADPHRDALFARAIRNVREWLDKPENSTP